VPAPVVNEQCGSFPNWYGPSGSTTAVVTLVKGVASCDEVMRVARSFFVDEQSPAGDWQCSNGDPSNFEHVGDCIGSRGQISVNVSYA
jgi:hypothetical protein